MATVMYLYIYIYIGTSYRHSLIFFSIYFNSTLVIVKIKPKKVTLLKLILFVVSHTRSCG